MKKLTILLLAALLYCSAAAQSEEQAVYNRYAMKLEARSDGSYSLINYKQHKAILPQIDTISDLLLPYRHVTKSVTADKYAGVETREFVYKVYPQYVLKLIVDMPTVDSEPAPFMVYIHGGGWARGNNTANRVVSQYLARQNGIAGVRITYTLAPQPNATILVTVEDVRDAVKFVREHASELGIDPSRFGFYGGSAGGHLAAVAALSIEGARVLVGNSGIYDLAKAAISARATQAERVRYFCGLDASVLAQCSPVNIIPADAPAVLLVHGTGDTTVEWQQSEMFYEALKRRGVDVTLDLRPIYDHNITSSGSDISEELMLNAVKFITEHI